MYLHVCNKIRCVCFIKWSVILLWSKSYETRFNCFHVSSIKVEISNKVRQKLVGSAVDMQYIFLNQISDIAPIRTSCHFVIIYNVSITSITRYLYIDIQTRLLIYKLATLWVPGKKYYFKSYHITLEIFNYIERNLITLEILNHFESDQITLEILIYNELGRNHWLLWQKLII